MRTFGRIAIACAVLAINAAALAQSASPAPASSPVPEAAIAAFNRGLELSQRQSWAEALTAFTEAYRLYPSAVVEFNIGYCQRALGEYVEALHTLEDFLSRPLEGSAAARREQASDLVVELRARVASVSITVDAASQHGIEVLLDGRTITLDPSGSATVSVNPGAHTVHARRDGFEPLFVDRTVGPGSRTTVEISLQPLPARIAVTADVRNATVRIDGRLAGNAPVDLAAGPGEHRIEVAARGYVTQRSTVRVRAGVTTRLALQLPHEPASLTTRWWFWSAIGVVVTAASVGTYFATRPAPQPPPYECGNLMLCLHSN